MEDLKIKVTSEAESKEVQELLFQLGCSWSSAGETIKKMSLPWILCRGVLLKEASELHMAHHGHELKETTLPELREIVILKRNSVGDATHVDQYGDKWVFIKGEWYFYGSDAWDSGLKDSMDRYTLKPITKNLKEYLNPSDWSLHLIDVDNDAAAEEWLEVPEGAFIYTTHVNHRNFFYRLNGPLLDFHYQGEWVKTNYSSEEYGDEMNENGRAVVWQRHTQPEELPFISDIARRLTPYEFNAMPDTTKVATFVDGCSFGKTESLQQELRDMNVTLDERQSTYGDYRITAEITQDLISVLHSHGYENMPNTHKDAMQMIVRKMARIINGDHNHADSWHDISGYARLVENSIEDGEI